MDTLKAAYKDDDDEIDQVSTPPLATAVDGSASTGAKLSTASADTKSESNHINGMKDESQAPASEELSSSEETPQDPDGDDEEDEERDEEEDRLQKKQKQFLDTPKPEPSDIEITDLPYPADAITPFSENGNPPTSTITVTKSSKKSKKKSKDVWVTTTRKGRKKTKHAFNSDQNGQALKESKVLIAPIPRFPDKNDDSPDLKICLSKVYKADKVELSEDRLSAGSSKGYRMVRATRGVIEGAWYFEIKVVHLGETGHTRLGWSMEKGDLQAPVGYDGNSFGYRDIDGSKVHKALREVYGEEGYKDGDVIGFYINLPDGGSYAPDLSRMVWYKGQRYASALDAKEDTPKVVPGSEIAYYKNGICQGVAFKDLYGGCYYPAASMYTLPNQPNCVVKFNFGPDFERFPDNFGEQPVPRPMIEVPYQSYDVRVENGSPLKVSRMCPMLKGIEDEDNKFLKSC